MVHFLGRKRVINPVSLAIGGAATAFTPSLFSVNSAMDSGDVYACHIRSQSLSESPSALKKFIRMPAGHTVIMSIGVLRNSPRVLLRDVS